MQNLRVDSVTTYARATDHIPQIVSQVQRLIAKGYAYKISDGYYFDIAKFKAYGKLAHRTNQEADDAIARIDEHKEKHNKGDFCLWKFKKENEPAWETSLHPGRPGWHVEDTAITEKQFGPQYDHHGGGMNLIFPHHEAEIAQMEAISGKKPFVKYWMHAGFLNIHQEKMSKSVGNFTTIRDTLQHTTPRVLRYLLLSSHYRKPIDFNPASLTNAQQALQRIDDFILKLKNYQQKGKGSPALKKLLATTRSTFEKAMDDDFETANALAAIFILIKNVNILLAAKKLSTTDVNALRAFFHEVNSIFSILDEEAKVPPMINDLVQQREKARATRNWTEADALREKLKKLGYTIDDTPLGSLLKKL